MKNIFNIKKNINRRSKAGFSLVEVLVACVIISTTTIALTLATSKGIELSNKALRQVQASMLIEEGVEAIKSIRDTNWNDIPATSSNTYYLSFNTTTNKWSLSVSNPVEVINIFTRKVLLSAVNRDSNDDIASSGTPDTGVKRANVIVSWSTPSGISSKNMIFYITNIFN